MKKRNLRNAVLWTVVMIVVQVVVDLVRHTAINWIEILIGGAIVFLICIGSKPNPTVVMKNKPQKGKTAQKSAENEDIIQSSATVENNHTVENSNTNNNANNMNMADLSFYSYNRIGIFSLAIGIGCIVFAQMGHVGNVVWLYVVGALCLVQAIVFYVFYVKKRDEFVAKEKKR